MKTAIIGAFDRFNYGDLLFPLVLREYLKQSSSTAELGFFAAIHGDMSGFGGVVARPRSELRGFLDSGPASLIVSGGEVLAARWSNTISSLDQVPERAIYQILGRAVSRQWADRLARRRLTARTELPWVFLPTELPSAIKVAYSAVGGSSLGEPKRRHQLERVREAARFATYFSVRDERTWNIITEAAQSLDLRLVPDSAATMPLLWPAERLKELSGAAAREITTGLGSEYLVFQVGKHTGPRSIKIISDQLRTLQAATDLGIALVAIGRAPAHEDSHPLRRIAALMPERRVMILETGGIFDIMKVISECRLFLGTSLHGNLTAVSYGRPAVGVNPNISKLASFYETWMTPASGSVVRSGDISTAGQNALNVPDSVRVEDSKRIVNAADSGVKEMLAALGLV